jgi:hypothetical protein
MKMKGTKVEQTILSAQSLKKWQTRLSASHQNINNERDRHENHQ